MDLRNKNVTVVGLGTSGLASALLLYDEEAIVSVTDSSKGEAVIENASLLQEKYIDTEIGGHTESFLHGTELLVVSPGVTKDSLPVSYAVKNKIPVISELELGFYFCKGPITAVTGTNGKSTVVSLVGHILKAANKPVITCGNIGNAFTGEIKKITKDTCVVLEVSSFQLEWIKDFRPMISVILNMAEDHMDRYDSFENYAAAKSNIFKNQKDADVVILNYDNLKSMGNQRPDCKTLYFSMREKVEGCYKDKEAVSLLIRNKAKKLFTLDGFNLKGSHNEENILAATLISLIMGVKPDVIEKAVRSFKSLSHRYETVREVGGVEFIDDSKATNIDSTYRAIESLNKKTVLIAGGKDKALPYEKIIPVLKKNVKAVVLIGEAKEKIKKAIAGTVPVVECNSMEEAVREGYNLAAKGESVLLSPMCSSFDMFKSYKDRGEAFRKTVERLSNKN